MKDYKEMTESVLHQAKTRAARQKNQRRMATGLIAASLCLAVLIAVGFGVGRNPADTTQPTISLQNPTTVPPTQPTETEPSQPETTAPKQEEVIVTTDNVYFLNATEEGVTLEPVHGNTTFPIAQVFRIWDMRGMTDEEKKQTELEAEEFQKEFRNKYGKLSGEGKYGGSTYDHFITKELSAGHASIVILDGSQVKSVERETTGVFNLGESYAIHHQDVTVGKDEYAVTFPAGSNRYFLNLTPTLETLKTIINDPSTPLSSFCETITITIHYNNGTKEIVVIDVTIDDDGQVYMTQRGNNTGV